MNILPSDKTGKFKLSWRSVISRRQLALLIQSFCLVSGFTPFSIFAALNQGYYPDWETRWPATEFYEPDCRPLWIPNKYGPFDYRTTSPADRDLVERAHFSLEYQAYQKGQKRTSRQMNDQPPAAGFGYTLWAFPNQPQALAAMEDLGIRHKTETPPSTLLRVHCFMQRAVRFAPDDALVRSIYGYYYARRGKSDEARFQLEKVQELKPIGWSAYVYAAFAYIEIKDFDKALSVAKQAYAHGYTLPGLKNRLERLGKWHD